MLLELWTDAPTEEGDTIPAGSIVKYCGHVPGGMVQVEWYAGRSKVAFSKRVIHPDTTKELRNGRKVAPL